MELIVGFVVIIIIVVVLGLMALGVYGFWVIATGGNAREKKKTLQREKLRTETFTGNEDSIVYKWTNFESLDRGDVIELANESGYRMVSSSDEKYKSTLVFERR